MMKGFVFTSLAISEVIPVSISSPLKQMEDYKNHFDCQGAQKLHQLKLLRPDFYRLKQGL